MGCWYVWYDVCPSHIFLHRKEMFNLLNLAYPVQWVGVVDKIIFYDRSIDSIQYILVHT